jgi:hypothetical protein
MAHLGGQNVELLFSKWLNEDENLLIREMRFIQVP